MGASAYTNKEKQFETMRARNWEPGPVPEAERRLSLGIPVESENEPVEVEETDSLVFHEVPLQLFSKDVLHIRGGNLHAKNGCEQLGRPAMGLGFR